MVILPKRLEESAAAFEALEIPVVIVNPETQDELKTALRFWLKLPVRKQLEKNCCITIMRKMDFCQTAYQRCRKATGLSGFWF